SRRRHTRSDRDWSSDVCSSDLSPSEQRDKTVASFGLSPRKDARSPRLTAYSLEPSISSNANRSHTDEPVHLAAGTAMEPLHQCRSEERRVGKECRAGWAACLTR